MTAVEVIYYNIMFAIFTAFFVDNFQCLAGNTDKEMIINTYIGSIINIAYIIPI